MNRLPCITIFIFNLCIVMMGAGCSKKEINSFSDTSQSISYTPIEWTELLPKEDLHALENPPEYITNVENGGDSDRLANKLKAEPFSDDSIGTLTDNAIVDPYQQALISKKIRPEFNGRHVRIPGFIVPLEFDDHETITTFFLVPFFGACLHLPPPPPNQIIYAEYEPGIKLDALYDPFWIDGTVSTTLIENEVATAAYSLTVAAIEPYTESASQEEGQQQE